MWLKNVRLRQWRGHFLVVLAAFVPLIPNVLVRGTLAGASERASVPELTILSAEGPADARLLAINSNLGQRDLAIAKNGPPVVASGTSFAYTLEITNLGPATAVDAVVTDTLPEEVTLVSASASQGTGCGGTTVVVCDLGNIEGYGLATVTIVVAVDPLMVGTMENSAVVAGKKEDADPHNNSDFITTLVEAGSELSIIKSASSDPVMAGEILTYTLAVTNDGPSVANGVLVSDTLPAEVALISATASQGAGCAGTDTVACDLGEMAVGSVATATIVVNVDPAAAGVIENSAFVAGTQIDPNTSNNNDVLTTVVEGGAELAISKTASPDPVMAGEALTYILEVVNSGPSLATGVVVTDSLPAGLDLISATPSQGAGCNGTGTVACDLGQLDVGNTATVTLLVNVSASAPATVHNIAIVSGDLADSAEGNNSASASTIVLGVFNKLYMPVTVRDRIGQLNDVCEQAITIVPNVTYQFLAEDVFDWFQFDLPAEGELTIDLDNFLPRAGQLAAYRGDDCGDRHFLASWGHPAAHKVLPLGIQPAGHYYVVVANDGPLNDTDRYELLVEYVPSQSGP